MNNLRNAFANLIAGKARAAATKANRSLSIAVLGPGLDDSNDLGARKRRQIRDVLKMDGHNPFFPEEIITADTPVSLLEQERSILSKPTVDLVIVLYTEGSYGAIGELAQFLLVPAIKAKTAVLWPIALYRPEQIASANMAQEYLIKMPYSDDHFTNCTLVSECRKWAHERLTGGWPGIVPHQF